MIKEIFKRENGSMAVYTSVVLLTMLIIITAIFITSNMARATQLQTAIKVKESYEKDNNKAGEIYEKLTGTTSTPSYVTNGLILHYDAINNTGNGHDNNATVWKDLSGNENDGSLIGFDSNSGWGDNYIKFDGQNDYVISKNNIGLSGDADLTMCAVALWDGDNWLSQWPSYMGINSYNSFVGLSMTMNEGKPALDFWNYRYRASESLEVKKIYQICMTKETGGINTTSKIFVNGEEVVGTGNSTSSPNISNSQAIVGKLDDARWANAKIYNVKYYNRALNNSEIKQNYMVDKQRYGF